MRTVTYVRALNEALSEEMARDDSVFIIGEEVGGVFGVTRDLDRRYGEHRVRCTPISEAAFTGLGVGAAMSGLRPIVEIMYVDFITVCWDQVVNQAAKLRYMSGGQVKLPLTIRAQQGNLTREAAQHSQHIEAWFAHTPGLKVVMPATVEDAKGLLKLAIRDDNPVVFLENRLLYELKGPMPRDEYTIPLGVAKVQREGTGITVVATSNALQKSLAAADQIADEVSVEVIDPRTIVPLDTETILTSVRKTGRLLVVHDAPTRLGFGAEVVRLVTEQAWDVLQAAPRVIGGLNLPMPFSPVLEDVCVPDVSHITEAIQKVVKS
jgi:pyruvate/2-oxoglutarate/acetoin dehydrogenase E1 component